MRSLRWFYSKRISLAFCFIFYSVLEGKNMCWDPLWPIQEKRTIIALSISLSPPFWSMKNLLNRLKNSLHFCNFSPGSKNLFLWMKNHFLGKENKSIFMKLVSGEAQKWTKKHVQHMNFAGAFHPGPWLIINVCVFLSCSPPCLKFERLKNGRPMIEYERQVTLW